MAASDSIRQTLNTLEDVLCETTNIADCLQDATASGEAPPWVFLLGRLVHKLDAAAQQLVVDVNHKCLPLMLEMEAISADHKGLKRA